HDRRDGDVKGIGHRGEDLAGGLLLAALHLTEVAERDGRLARDLAEGPTPLQAEVPQDIADLLSYKDHRNLLSVVSLGSASERTASLTRSLGTESTVSRCASVVKDLIVVVLLCRILSTSLSTLRCRGLFPERLESEQDG